MPIKNSDGYCDVHRLQKKEDIATGTVVGLGLGALFANPIGLIVGGIIGALVGNEVNKAKDDERRIEHNKK